MNIITIYNSWHVADNIICKAIRIKFIFYAHWHIGGLKPNIRLRKIYLFKWLLPLKYYDK